jgi:RimJ/RimL family protein N-acetyltransferase
MMPSLSLQGPRVRIRRARLEDAEASFRWFSDPRVTRFLPLAGEDILPMDSIERFLARTSRDDAEELAVTITLEDGNPIGCGGFRNFEAMQAEFSIVIGEPGLWRQGYGAEALGLLIPFAFSELRLGRVWLSTRSDNTAGLGLFARAGFRPTGTAPSKISPNGNRFEVTRMETTPEDWRRSGIGRAVGARPVEPERGR